jgi:hypothetical protein
MASLAQMPDSKLLKGVETLRADTHMTDWLQLIRAEYLESPGLRLTKAQVQRLWGLDHVTSEALLAELVDVKFLKRTRQDVYVRTNAD